VLLFLLLLLLLFAEEDSASSSFFLLLLLSLENREERVESLRYTNDVFSLLLLNDILSKEREKKKEKKNRESPLSTLKP